MADPKEQRQEEEERSEPEGKSAPKGLWAETKDFFKAIAWAFAIAIFLRSFVVEAYKIPSGSMLPTLEIGDHIFVNKFLYGLMIPGTTIKFFKWHHPRRGDVIVFKYPDNPSIDYIKRVIGVPGDRVDVSREDELFINGKKQETDYRGDVDVVDQECLPQRAKLYNEHLDGGARHALIHLPGRLGSGLLQGPFIVPEDHLLVMGDNRDNSADSVHAGYTVPFDNVKGKAMFIWLSWNSCGAYPSGFTAVALLGALLLLGWTGWQASTHTPTSLKQSSRLIAAGVVGLALGTYGAVTYAHRAGAGDASTASVVRWHRFGKGVR